MYFLRSKLLNKLICETLDEKKKMGHKECIYETKNAIYQKLNLNLYEENINYNLIIKKFNDSIFQTDVLNLC